MPSRALGACRSLNTGRDDYHYDHYDLHDHYHRDPDHDHHDHDQASNEGAQRVRELPSGSRCTLSSTEKQVAKLETGEKITLSPSPASLPL